MAVPWPDPARRRKRRLSLLPPMCGMEPRVIGLSVAIGRFVEALFWAMFRVAGALTLLVAGGALAVLIGFVALRWLLRRR